MGRGRFKFYVPEIKPDNWTPPGRYAADIEIEKFKYTPPPTADDLAQTSTSDVDKAKKRLSITSNYSIGTDDHFVGVDTTSGTVSLTLPAGASEGKIYTIKDEGGQAATNNITVQASDGALIDGESTVTLESSYSSISIYWNATSWHIY